MTNLQTQTAVVTRGSRGHSTKGPGRRVLGHKHWVARNEQNTRQRPAPWKEAAGLDDEEQRAPLQRDFSIVADAGLIAALPLSLAAGPKENCRSEARFSATRAVLCEWNGVGLSST